MLLQTVEFGDAKCDVVVLGISPQWLDGRLIGTVDTEGILGVEGPPHPDLANDYIAAVVRHDPERLIGFGSVNGAPPRSRVVPTNSATCSWW